MAKRMKLRLGNTFCCAKEASPVASPVASPELGSILPLVLGYFFISLMAIFLTVNIAAAYIQKKELIYLLEGSLLGASHHLDKFSYYYGISKEISIGEIIDFTIGSTRVPIDCNQARDFFNRDIYLQSNVAELTRSSQAPVIVRRFDCDGTTITAQISKEITLPIQLPIFGITTSRQTANASVTSVIR